MHNDPQATDEFVKMFQIMGDTDGGDLSWNPSEDCVAQKHSHLNIYFNPVNITIEN